ncbi:MAG TPA: transporter [Terriglobales bacterium]|nr:transporter [Terriglobales bacterium]
MKVREGCFVLMLICAVPLSTAGQDTTTTTQSPPVKAGRNVFDLTFGSFEANPNRPSSSNSADVLAPGELQLEYGFSRDWGTDHDRQNLLGGELRVGVWRNIELRWGGNSFVENESPGSNEQGFGDQYLSAQYRFHEQTEEIPALALSYAIKFPTGDESRGLGSGRTDHAFTFLASKDIHKITIDFNAGYQLVGQEGADGYNQNAATILTFSRTLYGPLTGMAEISSETRLGDQPAFATTLWGLSWRVRRQLVLDSAIDVGITKGAPHKRILFGLTYAIARIHSRQQRGSQKGGKGR